MYIYLCNLKTHTVKLIFLQFNNNHINQPEMLKSVSNHISLPHNGCFIIKWQHNFVNKLNGIRVITTLLRTANNTAND